MEHRLVQPETDIDLQPVLKKAKDILGKKGIIFHPATVRDEVGGSIVDILPVNAPLFELQTCCYFLKPPGIDGKIGIDTQV